MQEGARPPPLSVALLTESDQARVYEILGVGQWRNIVAMIFGAVHYTKFCRLCKRLSNCVQKIFGHQSTYEYNYVTNISTICLANLATPDFDSYLMVENPWPDLVSELENKEKKREWWDCSGFLEQKGLLPNMIFIAHAIQSFNLHFSYTSTRNCIRGRISLTWNCSNHDERKRRNYERNDK